MSKIEFVSPIPICEAHNTPLDYCLSCAYQRGVAVTEARLKCHCAENCPDPPRICLNHGVIQAAEARDHTEAKYAALVEAARALYLRYKMSGTNEAIELGAALRALDRVRDD